MSQQAEFDKLGIIAGGGDLPVILAEATRAEGRPYFVLGVNGFADPDFVKSHGGVMLSIGETGGQIRALKQAEVKTLCFAGLVKRPDFRALRLDRRGMMILPKVIAAAAQGDDSLLRVILSVFETEGFKVVGAETLTGGLLAAAGAVGRLSPNDEQMEDLAKAAYVASEIGRLDIGQGAVSCRGLVLAVEAQEGTDKMLQRCQGLPQELRGDDQQRAGVLVKRPKPQQERRIDLPTIGVRTVEGVAKAGLAGLAVEAGSALLVDRLAIARTADALGVWVYGFTEDELTTLPAYGAPK